MNRLCAITLDIPVPIHKIKLFQISCLPIQIFSTLQVRVYASIYFLLLINYFFFLKGKLSSSWRETEGCSGRNHMAWGRREGGTGESSQLWACGPWLLLAAIIYMHKPDFVPWKWSTPWSRDIVILCVKIFSILQLKWGKLFFRSELRTRCF